jgi:hypothetical protein
MEDLVSKTEEFIEVHKQTYNKLFDVDLSFIGVLDCRVKFQEDIRHQIEKIKDKFNKKARDLARELGISEYEARIKLRQHLYKDYTNRQLQKASVPLMEFGSLEKPHTIFVYDCQKNHEKLIEPFTFIEHGCIHELGHAFFNMLTHFNAYNCDNEKLAIRIVMATEGFADVITSDYVIPYLRSDNLTERVKKYKADYSKINTAASGKIDIAKFNEGYKEYPIFRNALAYRVFSGVNLKDGLDGLKKVAKNLPQLEDYFP